MPSSRGFELAAKYGMQFFETSAKSGAGVEDAFNFIADGVVETRYADDPPPQITPNVSLQGGGPGS